MESRTVRDRPGYRITLHRGAHPSDVLLVSFGSVGSDLEEQGFGTELAMDLGYDNLYVSQRGSSQYQDLSREELAEAAAPITRDYRRVIAYGASLGGYAALYYGGALDAEIIAVSPINSAHPMIRRASFARLPFVHDDVASGPLSSHEPVIVYDPMMPDDQAFIDETIAPAYPGARYVRFPYAGHKVLITLNHSGVAGQFIRPLLERGEIIEVPVRTEDSYIWHTEQAREHVRQERWQQAEDHLTRALDLNVTKHAAKLLARVYHAQGREADLRGLESAIRESSVTPPPWLPFPQRWLDGEPETVVSAGEWEPGATTSPVDDVAVGQTRRLADQPGYRIAFHRTSSAAQVLLVAFGGASIGLSTMPGEQALAESLGYDLVTVTSRKGACYQELSLDACQAAVGAVAATYPRVVAYGVGLGGYAALHYGPALSARILAGAPRNPAHPVASPKGELPAFVHGELGALGRPTGAPVVLLDPTRKADRRFVEQVVQPALPATSVLELAYSGPNTFVPLREQDLLTPLLRELAESDETPAVSLQHEGSHIWHRYHGRALLREQQWQQAEEQLREALRLKYTKDSVRALGELYQRTKRHQDLLELREEAARQLGDSSVLPDKWFDAT